MVKAKQSFISHATEDAKFAHTLADDLRRLGMPVWIVPESICAGESWVEAIERGLQESSHVLVVLTPAAVESQWVKKEVEIAIALECEKRIQLIPLELKPTEIPLLLKSYQMVSFCRDYIDGLRQLANSMGLSINIKPMVNTTKKSEYEPAAPAKTAPVLRNEKIAEVEKALKGLTELKKNLDGLFSGEGVAFGYVGVTVLEKHIGASISSRTIDSSDVAPGELEARGWKRARVSKADPLLPLKRRFSFLGLPYCRSWEPATSLQSIAKEIISANELLGLPMEKIVIRSQDFSDRLPFFAP